MSGINKSIVKRTASESLARVAMQTPQNSATASPVYENSVYREHYTTAASGPTDPALTSQNTGYNNVTGGVTHAYDIGHSNPPPQSSNAYEQQKYSNGDDSGISSSHAALAVTSSSTPSQSSTEAYLYANPHAHVLDNSQTAYPPNGLASQDWRQWTRTHMQPRLSQPGEYLNTATTLMTLGRGESHGPESNNQVLVDGAPHWPNIAHPNSVNDQMGHL